MAREWRPALLWPVLALLFCSIGGDYSVSEEFGAEAVGHCNDKCPFQNRTGDGHFDMNCGTECNMEQCTLGCSLWKRGLEQSCQTVCNVTSDVVLSKELYCVMGCNEALNTYFQKLRELIGTPPAPALVADSLTATSLSLVWEASDLTSLSYLVQWRYEELGGAWQYCANKSWDQSTITLDNLQPYTKYRFRVAVFLSKRGARGGEPVVSMPSVVMSTLAAGRPSSAPAGLRAAAPDPTRVSITWEPGSFPNGPLISYVLRVADSKPNSYVAMVDMPASNKTLFYMFQNLSPAREYTVSVAMRNAEGEGPRAYVQVTTPPLPAVVSSQQPVLILGGVHTVLAAQAQDMLSDRVEIYTTRYTITGVGLDLSNDYLFVSETSGCVYRSSLSHKTEASAILTPASAPYKPLALSVDWLNRHLYILGEVEYTNDNSGWGENTMFANWEILRCDFNGKSQLVAVSGFNSKPVHIEVDPYNGYLFWALQGVERGGLYRLDLANISNGIKHESAPELIVRDAHLGAFTVDHANFRLLVSHSRRNTVLSVSLDGREVSDFRNNTQKPMFHSVKSMAFAGGLFYWSNGEEMLTEEYHAEKDSYFHNEYPPSLNTNTINKVLVALRSCQPIPVAVNPPIAVQSVMGITKAKISWSPPHLLGHQGNGAWQHWHYHVQITDLATSDTILRKDINSLAHIIEDLKEDTEYIIKAAAVTESGSGPWSSEFVGRTLASSANILRSTILWSGKDGLLQTDLTGDNAQILVHKSHLERLHITDISWYHDRVYLVTNASTVLWYNTTAHTQGWMQNMDNVGSLAVDWVGKRLYWSNPKQQLITRGNLQGGNREPVPIVTVAKELTIDSVEAYIYWNTGHAVESARLTGEHKRTYYPAQLFSGKQVMGLTVDLESKWLYWIVRGYEGSELHRAPTADRIPFNEEVSDTLISSLVGASPLGPLCYFSSRLVWLRDQSHALISDLTGHNTASLAAELTDVHTIAVVDPTLHTDSENLTAIPEAIEPASIRISGPWNAFNVSWTPATRVNHGLVSYDVSVHVGGHFKLERTVRSSWLMLDANATVPAPYSEAEVVVRAHTQWGGGGAARARVRTPSAPPTAPRRPRVFLQRATSEDGSPTATFRWDAPEHANGLIRGYDVTCWHLSAPPQQIRTTVCKGDYVAPEFTQYQLKYLIKNLTYYFQVRAFTDAGYGPFSKTISISSDVQKPVPRIVISSQDAIRITDLDSGDSDMVPKSSGIPVDFTVSTSENFIYWVNNLEEIFVSRINGSGLYKLTSINGSASSLSIDWVARVLYWSQQDAADSTDHAVYRLELSHAGPTMPVRLLSRPHPVYSMQIAPLTRSLYWYEEGTHLGLGTIMTSKSDGSDLRTFFYPLHNQLAERNDCNCPENPEVSKSFVLDMTRLEYKLFWVDPWVHKIVSSDMNGCYCSVVVETKNGKNYGLPPTSMTVDSKNIYWFNSSEKTIYYADKSIPTHIEIFNISTGYEIFALDPSNQPYPPKDCLIPNHYGLTARMSSTTATSVILELPIVGYHEECNFIDFEMATPVYTVFYRLVNENDSASCDQETCSFVTTSDNKVVLPGLQPFTNYSVSVQVTNYYGKLLEVKPVLGPSVIVRTAAEAPKAAGNVTWSVLSPVLAYVEWQAEPGLWYEVHWRTDDVHKFKEHNTFIASGGGMSEGRWGANITRLSPGTAYAVWVRAHSNHSHHYTDSALLHMRTHPQPDNITLVARTAYTLNVLSLPYRDLEPAEHTVEYGEWGGSHWTACTRRASRGEWRARELRPRTRYRFRLRLRYRPNAPLYYWPQDDRFVYETSGDRPGPPGIAALTAVSERVLRASWSPADPHGFPLQAYRVWGKPAHRTESPDSNITTNHSETLPTTLQKDVDDTLMKVILLEGWELLYNGTENYWIITEGLLKGRYTLLVQARNELGWGALSAPSEPLDLSELAKMATRHDHVGIALGIGVALITTLALSALAGFIYLYKKRGDKKSALDSSPLRSTRTARGPDVELATLRELPRARGGGNLSTNVLYAAGAPPPTDAELAALPHIRRDQITLTKFLGSGAFGEVFEGVAKNLNSRNQHTKVAVKTLRKGATDQEKTEFLQEAQLMSNFKHDHILSLLGVCLDNDPNFIIMELMEGGDLLSYLREKRPSLYTSESLTLLDLLSMCVDVTRGCRYLEEMHFVHRDLAARNCLVSNRSGSSSGRVVKIGDFGLARDIYKNDYYRKEGEGLLPVRWMAPECLVDGVFSVQSDVWAWGVLCWEVLSLGQQPYPAQTNHQVLAHVRAGGTPSRPPNCPSAAYDLLQKCWSYNPERRPTFKHCLEVMLELRGKTSPNITLTATAVGAPHYLTLLRDVDAVTNRTYLLDENDNAFIDEEMPEGPMSTEPIPKYLELAYHNSQATTSGDGYEIPRSPLDRLPPAYRHSIVGVAPGRLIKPPLYRASSLRAPMMRPTSATIIPLRQTSFKRASLCEELRGSFDHLLVENPRAETPSVDQSDDGKSDILLSKRMMMANGKTHTYKTPF